MQETLDEEAMQEQSERKITLDTVVLCFLPGTQYDTFNACRGQTRVEVLEAIEELKRQNRAEDFKIYNLPNNKDTIPYGVTELPSEKYLEILRFLKKFEGSSEGKEEGIGTKYIPLRLMDP